MKPTDQRIALAELRGYKCEMYPGKVKGVLGWVKDGQYVSVLPDYLNSHDAMADAEKALANSLEEALYTSRICDLAGIPDRVEWENVPRAIRAVCFATPARKAEALLKVKGLWRETGTP